MDGALDTLRETCRTKIKHYSQIFLNSQYPFSLQFFHLFHGWDEPLQYANMIDIFFACYYMLLFIYKKNENSFFIFSYKKPYCLNVVTVPCGIFVADYEVI